MDDGDVLLDALRFHGHRCWAGVRAGLAALRTLGVRRSGGTQLYGIVETGEDHGWTNMAVTFLGRTESTSRTGAVLELRRRRRGARDATEARLSAVYEWGS